MCEDYRSLHGTDADVAIGVLSERWCAHVQFAAGAGRRRMAGAGPVTIRQQLQYAGETCSRAAVGGVVAAKDLWMQKRT
jgi:hypothetical protein